MQMRKLAAVGFAVITLGLSASAVLAAKPTSSAKPEIAVAEFGTGKVAHVTVPDKGHVSISLIDVNGSPFDVKSPDGVMVYASVWSSGAPGSTNGIKILSFAKKDTVTGAMATSGTPRYMVINDAGTVLAVATSNGVDLFNIAGSGTSRANLFITTITFNGAMNVAFSGTRLAIVGSAGVALYDISNSASPVLIANRDFGTLATAVTFSPGNSKLYVGFGGQASAYDANSNLLAGNLFVLNTSTLAPQNALQLDFANVANFSIAYSRLYVTADYGVLNVIDTVNDTLVASTNLGSYLSGIDSSATKLFVAEENFGKVYTIILGGSASTDQIGLAVDLGASSQPIGLEVLK